ncbi:hypothetical protein QBC41DRAFT_287122 [Cercophora samala]|uniref:Uncharacterized protein n=1 Tax=Cercophora samala TaxID=330535 RepID=A0AA39YVK2_9PEZI|nr:hypothetical protein QBC41DRAFT_287122 [Cercophora samala]
MASNARYPRSNARRNGNRGYMLQTKPSNNNNNGRDDEEDDRPPRPSKRKTYVSLLSDSEEEEADGKAPPQKRNVSRVDGPNNGPAPKRVASTSVAGNNQCPFSTTSAAVPASGSMLPPAPPQQPDTVSQLVAQVHQAQDANSMLMQKMDDLRIVTAQRDAEIASLRAIIEGNQRNQQTAANNSLANTSPVQQHPSQQQPALPPQAAACTTCFATNDLKKSLAEAHVNVSKARNTIVHQHDEIKGLRVQATSAETALIEERAAVTQHKLTIDQLSLKVAAEQATVKDLQNALANNQLTLEHLNERLAAQGHELAAKNQELDAQRQVCSAQAKELSEARTTITTNDSTIADLQRQLADKQREMEAARSKSEKEKVYTDELKKAIENFKQKVANGQAKLDDARTTLFVNGTVIQDLKDQVATSEGTSSDGTIKGKDGLPDLEQEALRATQADFEQEIEKLKERVDKADKECDQLRMNYHEDQETKEGLKNNLRSAREKEDQAITRAEGLEKELDENKRQLAECEAKLRQQEENHSFDQQKEAILKQQRQAFDQENERMETLLASFEDELTRLRSQAAPETETLKASLQSVNEQLARAQAERDDAVNKVEKLNGSYLRQADQLQSIRTASDMSRDYAASLKNQLAAKDVEIAQLEKKIAGLEDQLVACQTWADETYSQKVQIQEQLQQLKAQDDKNLETIKRQEYTVTNLNVELLQRQGQLQALRAAGPSQMTGQREANNQAAMQAHIAHLQSQIEEKTVQMASAREELDRVHSQYSELTDERAKDKKRIADLMERLQLQVVNNQTLEAHWKTVEGERNKALDELAATKERADFLRRREKALDEGGDPEFAYLESEWEPKLRDAQAQLAEASKEAEECRLQLQTVSRERHDVLLQLEASKMQLAEFQLTVEHLNNQLSSLSMGEGNGIDPVVQDMLQKARGIQSAGDVPRKVGNGVSSMFVNPIFRLFRFFSFFANFFSARKPIQNEAKPFLMPLRAEPVPDAQLKALKKENLIKTIRDLETEHERVDDTIRDLITRVKAESIKTAALQKEVRVWKAIAATKDMLIDQATNRLFGSPGGDDLQDQMNIGFDLHFNDCRQKPAPVKLDPEKPDVEMKDAAPPRKSLVITFGPTRRGYQCWKGDELEEYDRLDVNASKQIRVGYLTHKGRSIFAYLENQGSPPKIETPGPSLANPPVSSPLSSPLSEINMDLDHKAGSRYTTIESASSPPRPSAASLRSPSRSTPHRFLIPPAPVQFGVARRGGASSTPCGPHSTHDSTQPSYTSAVYPASSPGPSHRGFIRGRYTTTRFAPSTTPTLAGPSQPHRTSTPTSTPQSWAAGNFGQQGDIDMEVLGSGFTMESIEQPEEPEELEAESQTDKGKGKERAGSGVGERHEG